MRLLYLLSDTGSSSDIDSESEESEREPETDYDCKNCSRKGIFILSYLCFEYQVLHNQLFFLHTTLLLILLAATAPFPTDRSDGNMLLCDPCKDEFMKYGDNNHVKVVFSSPSEVSNNMQK